MSTVRIRGAKCFCQATLRTDGTCPHRCDPALARPAQRRRLEAKQAKERERRAIAPIGLTVQAVSAATKRVLPARLTDPWKLKQIHAFKRWHVGAIRG